MMATETFDFCVKVGSSGSTNFRTRKAQFGDGYEQRVGDGLNTVVQSWTVNSTNNKEKLMPLKEFLDRHAGHKAFYWTPPMGEQGLYYCETYTSSGEGNQVFTISATLQQTFAP
ncbi:phage tail protein [Pandoraea apista]|uniref:phage tail protein n=1 Tax=Pandoraea apista TaxID=93218 RepID=UPI001C12CE0E|nr:phage tail protein [Pandoraea apista]